MSDLTIEKMDRINFLITEVSLECLGNKFFDIYGNKTNSLLGLISVNTLKTEPTAEDCETDLWKSLTAEKKKIIVEKKILSQDSQVTNEPRQKRRASFTITNNEPDTSNDPESLLVPMTIPKAAKISMRRSTISVQMAKQRKLSMPPQPTKSRKHAQIQHKQQPDTAERKQRTIPEIKQNLKRDINIRYNAMRLLSESQEEKYRTLNINPNMEDFHKAEEKSLFSQCNTLIQFIKFIQESGTNASKLANISQAILELQKEF